MIAGQTRWRYRPQTVKLMRAMTTPPTAARAAVINTLIGGLITDSLWDKIGAMWVPAAHAEQAGLLNWKAPGTYTMVATNSPTFAADEGFTGNGTDAHLLNSSVNLTALGLTNQNSFHMGAWGFTDVQTDAYMVSNYNGSNTNRISPWSSGDDFYGTLNGTTFDEWISNTASTSIGHFVAVRRGATETEGYHNGSAQLTDNGASAGVASGGLAMLRYFSTYSAVQISVFHIGTALSDAEVSTLYGHLNTYMGAL